MANTNPTEVAEAPQVPVTRHLGWALALISVTQLLIVLDGSIVTIALPFIGADLDMSGASLTWLTIGYALFFGGLLLLGGRLGDMFGYRRMLVTGMVGFAVASVLGGLAANGPLLLAVRILQEVAPRSSPPPPWPWSPPPSRWVRRATAPSASTPRCPAPAPGSA